MASGGEKPVDDSPPPPEESLGFAAAMGMYDKVLKHLEIPGTDLDHVDGGDVAPVIRAALNGHADIVDLLLNNGSSLHHKQPRAPPNDYNPEDWWKESVVLAAVKADSVPVLEVLDRHPGVDFDEVTKFGPTPLMAASVQGTYKAAQFLIPKVDVNKGRIWKNYTTDEITEIDRSSARPKRLKVTPLWLACQKGDLRMVMQLVKAGATDWDQAPFNTLCGNYTEERLDELGEDPRLKWHKGPLFLVAATYFHKEVCKYLVNHFDGLGRLADNGHCALRILFRLSHEIDLYPRSSGDDTKNKNILIELYEFILNHLCDSKVLINKLHGQSPLFEAINMKKLPFVKRLVEAGENVNQRECVLEECMPLITYAAQCGYVKSKGKLLLLHVEILKCTIQLFKV